MRKAILALLFAVAFVAACVQQPTPIINEPPEEIPVTQEPPSPLVNTTPNQTATPPSKDPNVDEYDVIARQWEFVPETLRGTVNKTLRIRITSTDVAHGFAIPEFNINEEIGPGETKVIEFKPDRAGTFKFYCSVYCGAGHIGMDGILIVNYPPKLIN